MRAAQPDALLTHFVHIPWPQSDYWRALPGDLRAAVHEGLLANDVVGFHTERWRTNFVGACDELLAADCERRASVVRHGGRDTHVVAQPISIDVDEFDALREEPAVLAEEQLIVGKRPELLVVRVDRTDPSKNIVRGFRAFALLLERHPELHGRVGMLALLDPSRQSLPQSGIGRVWWQEPLQGGCKLVGIEGILQDPGEIYFLVVRTPYRLQRLWGQTNEAALEGVVLGHRRAGEVGKLTQRQSIRDALTQLAIVPVLKPHQNQRAQNLRRR